MATETPSLDEEKGIIFEDVEDGVNEEDPIFVVKLEKMKAFISFVLEKRQLNTLIREVSVDQAGSNSGELIRAIKKSIKYLKEVRVMIEKSRIIRMPRAIAFFAKNTQRTDLDDLIERHKTYLRDEKEKARK
jgi:hypothetical protein